MSPGASFLQGLSLANPPAWHRPSGGPTQIPETWLVPDYRANPILNFRLPALGDWLIALYRTTMWYPQEASSASLAPAPPLIRRTWLVAPSSMGREKRRWALCRAFGGMVILRWASDRQR